LLLLLILRKSLLRDLLLLSKAVAVVFGMHCSNGLRANLLKTAGKTTSGKVRLRFQRVAPAYGQIFQYAPVVVGKCIVVVVVVVEKIVVVAKVVVGQVEFQSASAVVVGKVVVVVEVVVQIVVEKVVVVVVQGCCCCGLTALLQWSVGEPSENRRVKSQWQWGLSQLGIGQ
jgi:hypothetical protein